MHVHVAAWIHQYGYVGIFLVFMTEMLGAPFPAETTLTAAGVGWSHGLFRFTPLWLTAALGNVVGSSIAYTIGGYFGPPLLHRLRWRFRSSAKWTKAESQFETHKVAVIGLGKFVSIVRVLIPFLAGVSRTSFVLFTVINTVSALTWAALFILEGKYMGILSQHYHTVLDQHREAIALLILLLVLAIWGWRRWRK